MEQARHRRVVEVDGEPSGNTYRIDTHDERGWFTVEEVANREEVTERTVFRWLEQGKVEKKEFEEESRYRLKEWKSEKSTECTYRDFPLKEHRRRLEEETGEEEEWDFLRGHLDEPGWKSQEVCPDEIAPLVAKLYAITDAGRLFRLQEGGKIVERRWPSTGQWNLSVEGTRWQPRADALLKRVFPKPHDREPKKRPEKTAVIHRETYEVTQQ